MEIGEEVVITPVERGFIPRDHTLVDGKLVGNVLGPDGKPITMAETRSGPPISGPIKLSDIGQHLLGQNKMWMDNGYMKDLAQRPERTQVLSNYYGAMWGSPHTTIQSQTDGQTMKVYTWDWRYDGSPNLSGAGFETTGPWGDTTHYAEIRNRSSMTAPGAFTGNGYFLVSNGHKYTASFNFDRYRKTHSSHTANMAFTVLGYPNGYLNGSRIEYVAYQNFNPTNNPSGTRSYTFTGSRSYKHCVINFNWWCPAYSGATEGIECAIIDAKVTRTA